MNPNVVLSKINYYFYSRFSSHKKEYLNLGGGVTFEHVNFFKLDVDSRVITDEEKGVYNFDLTKDLPLPFSDGSIVGVYTSHCIEHLTEAEVAPIFLDSYRVLKSGGTLRVVVPNMAEIFDAYDKREASYFQWLRDKQTNRGQIWVYDSWIRVVTRMFAGHVVDCLNDTELKQMYTKLGRKQFVSKILSLAEEYPERWGPGSHKSAWTPDSMKKMLENAGFKKIELSQRGQSKDKIFRNLGKFDTTMPNASLFIEAHK